MTCHECKEQLLEHFGHEALPADLAAHVAQCEACGRIWSELSELKGDLGANADSFPEEHEAELVAELVERQIRIGTVVTEVHGVNWMRYVAVAAVVALVSISTVVWKMSSPAPQVITKVDTVSVGNESEASDSDDELSTTAVATLLEDYTGKSSFSAGDELLGDLTDEEAAYLEKQIKAGDLL